MGKIIGIEALLRWHNPNLGIVPPIELIPFAEETGLIISIGEWVLITACRQIKRWHDKGHIVPKIAVNISPLQLKDAKFVERVAHILQDIDLDPQFLELEITESVAIFNEDITLVKLYELKKIGIKLEII